MDKATIQLDDHGLLGVLHVAVGGPTPGPHPPLAAARRQSMRTLHLPGVAPLEDRPDTISRIVQHVREQSASLHPDPQASCLEETYRRGEPLLAGIGDHRHGLGVASSQLRDVDDRLFDTKPRRRQVALSAPPEARASNQHNACRSLDVTVAVHGDVDDAMVVALPGPGTDV
ncbi:hypothetical protein [Terrabacter sp. RAF57]|jgi:hypothetical protein|uniref:hypothetical protein n=1 Tax=Terrabacter sp. RAF57 TaxID=3233063 RepID=UPI003F9CB806